MTDTCATCRFWEHSGVGEDKMKTVRYGNCLRYPPDPIHNTFPRAWEIWWCGEHQHLPEPPA